MIGLQRRVTVVLMAMGWLAGADAYAQNVPWDVFADPSSDSVCDLVNASNAELVVLSNTGELVIVTGTDVILADTFVDLDSNVFFDGLPAGLLTFATDDDGFRTLWWVGLNGNVVSVDLFTGEPSVTNERPSDFADVPCDACDFWDDQSVCPTSPPPTPNPPVLNISFCGAGAGMSMALTVIGLGLIGRRRWYIGRPR
jgi:hypothetical protein